MSDILHVLLEITIQSSVLILAFIVIRALAKGRINPRWQYAMWGIVLLRLIIPVSVSSMFSIMNLMPVQSVGAAPSVSKLPTLPNVQPNNASPVVTMPALPDTAVNPTVPVDSTVVTEPTAAPVSIMQILFWVWIAGMIAACLYFLIINLRFANRLKSEMTEYTLPEKYQHMIGRRTRTFISNSVASPCVMGFFTHKIIFTPQAVSNDAYVRYTLKHELCHLRQRDNIIALIRNIVCAVYWFNPLVWIAALFSRKDCETACDAAVLGTLSQEEGFEYGKTLIALIRTGQKRSDMLNTATTMTGGKKEMKERIQLIAKRPKALLITAVLLIITVTATVVVACTSAQNTDFERTLKVQEYGDQVCINDLTPFEWNVMYSFDYNASESEILQCVGEKYAKIIDELDGNKFNVVFMNEGEVVFAGYGDPIEKGYQFDFGTDANNVVKLYAAYRPMFKVADHKNGTKVFVYLEQERRYAEIIKNYSGYTPAMSSVPGLPLEPSLDIQSMTITCDSGELFLWTEDFGPRGNSIKVEEKRTVYWSPTVEDDVDKNINEANITVDAVLSNGSTVYQTLKIKEGDDGFYHLSDNNSSLSTQYTQVISRPGNYYSPTMSSRQGIELSIAIQNVKSIQFTCDQGQFIENSEPIGASLTTDGKSRIVWGADLDNWDDEQLNGQYATINVIATLDDGTQCEDIINIIKFGVLFGIDSDEFNQFMKSQKLPQPKQIKVSSDNKTIVLKEGDSFFEDFYNYVDVRFPREKELNIAALAMSQGDVEGWKNNDRWVELYYSKGDLDGVSLGENKLTDETRLLIFLTGDYADNIFIYGDKYGHPIYLQEDMDITPALQTAFAAKNDKSEWEVQSDGAKVRLYTVEETIVVDEGIEVLVEVRAEVMAGDRATDVDIAAYKTFNILKNGTLIMEEIGTEGQKNVVTLQPGQSVDFALTHVGLLESGVYSLSSQFGNLTLPSIEVNITKDQLQQPALSDEETAEQVLTSFLTEYYKGISLGGFKDAQGSNTTDLDQYVEWNDNTRLCLTLGEYFAEVKRLGGSDQGSLNYLQVQSAQKQGDKVTINGYFKTSNYGTLIDAELTYQNGRYMVTKAVFPDMKEYIMPQKEVDEIQSENPNMTYEDAVNEFHDRWIIGLLGNHVFDPNGKKDAPLKNQIQPLIEKGCSLHQIDLYLESQGAKKLLVNLTGPVKDTGVIWEGAECVWNENGIEEGWMNEVGNKDTYVLKKNDFDTLPAFLIDKGNVDYNTLTNYVNGFEDKTLPCNIWVEPSTQEICLLAEVYVP